MGSKSKSKLTRFCFFCVELVEQVFVHSLALFLVYSYFGGGSVGVRFEGGGGTNTSPRKTYSILFCSALSWLSRFLYTVLLYS